MKQIFLGEAMKNRREEQNLSQEVVCDGICDVTTLSRLENGRQNPTHNRIKALMQRLNMPDDRYYALLSKQEMELDNASKELSACISRFSHAEGEPKKLARTLAMEQLNRLESLVEQDDTITQQSILSYKVILGHEEGPYSLEESQETLLRALRLTAPKLDLDKLAGRRYTILETRILSQIAGTYSRSGEHAKALRLYEQLYEYVRKFDDQLPTYAPHFAMITHNYARELGVQKYFSKSNEIAEQGKQVSVVYGYYQFLPGFLAIMGENYYLIGEKEKSKKYCIQAHYLYEVLGDTHALSVIDPDIKKRFNIDFDS